MNCKAGDLAYAVRGLTTRFDRPPVVEVVSFYAVHPMLGTVWLVRSREPLPFVDSDGMRDGFQREVHAADDWLRPISGVPVHDGQLDEVPA